MRYILCQPSIKRFEWELEVCITRLQKLGVQDIVLLFTRHDDSVPVFLREKYNVETHVYDDTRSDKDYIPSVKPYLWSCYLKEKPERENDSYFYIDSDVLFREIPNIEPSDKTWYASDCTGYIDNDYIDSKDPALIDKMCRAIDIEPQLIRDNEPVGGAQWLIKNPSYDYWQKVYQDSITLYKLLSQSGTDIQKWTAEMWAQLWNVYHFGKQVKSPQELDFAWPTDDVESYYETKIYHNAGVTSGNSDMFFKGEYVNKSPFNKSFNDVNENKASIEYVKAIEEVVHQ